METKEIKITVPEGFEIDEVNSTPTNIIIKKIENEKPKTWEELLQTYPTITSPCGDVLRKLWYVDIRDGRTKEAYVVPSPYKFPTKEATVAFHSLSKLIQLRDAWWGDWRPDWTNLKEVKYTINIFDNDIIKDTNYRDQTVLAFPTAEMRDEFLEAFKHLIEKAKMFL